MPLNGEKVARKIVEVASDKLAEDIVLLDVRELCSFADYFVICSGESKRQTSAIADEIDKALHKKGPKLQHKEGNVESGWLLMDYGDIIVHIFGAEDRKFYQLDKLWAKAKPLVRIE